LASAAAYCSGERLYRWATACRMRTESSTFRFPFPVTIGAACPRGDMRTVPQIVKSDRDKARTRFERRDGVRYMTVAPFKGDNGKESNERKKANVEVIFANFPLSLFIGTTFLSHFAE
jgi:hypothetical protein